MNKSDYWNLDTFQKAELTMDQIEAFRKVELMIQGVIAPEKPEFPQTPPSLYEFMKDKGIPAMVATIGGTRFKINPEDKETLLRLSVDQLGREYNYQDPDIYYPGDVKPIQIEDMLIFPQFHEQKLEYNKIYGDKLRRKAEWDKYLKEKEAADKTTTELTEDWHCAQNAIALYRRVNETLKGYILMAGTEEKAAFFLWKTFGYNEMTTFNRLRREKELPELKEVPEETPA